MAKYPCQSKGLGNYNDLGCYDCREPSVIGFQMWVGGNEPAPDVSSVKRIFQSLGYYTQITDIDFGVLKIGACEKHKPNLLILEERVKDPASHISKQIIKESLSTQVHQK
jgi:hypothetical protein